MRLQSAVSELTDIVGELAAIAAPHMSEDQINKVFGYGWEVVG